MQSTRFTSAEAYLLVKDVFIEVREELPGDNELESAENSAAVSAGILAPLVHAVADPGGGPRGPSPRPCKNKS